MEEETWREQRLLSPALSSLKHGGEGEDIAANIGFGLQTAGNIGRHRAGAAH